MRLFTLAAFTLFQVANAATANYGFFCYLAVVLGVFLLDDADVVAARGPASRAARDSCRRALRRFAARVATLRRKLPRPALPALLQPRARRWVAIAGATLFALVSLADALVHFGEPVPALSFMTPLLERDWRLRLVEHLSPVRVDHARAHRARIPDAGRRPDRGREADDAAWTAQHLRHKPGDVTRAPDFVAPHQPRVDFRLWFYGLAFQRRAARVRLDAARAAVRGPAGGPAAVSRATALPAGCRAPRVLAVSVHQPAEKRATGAWWRRTRLATMRALPCPKLPDRP